MLSEHLIRIIENHADEITWGAVRKLQNSVHTPSYQLMPREELHRRAFEVYHDLHHWLLESTDEAIQARYEELGKQRFREGTPLAEVIWALILTKDHLRQWIASSVLAGSALELYREQEIYRLVGRFFDRAVCYAAIGYERYHAKQEPATAS